MNKSDGYFLQGLVLFVLADISALRERPSWVFVLFTLAGVLAFVASLMAAVRDWLDERYKR